jgi:hypothetical protein
MEFGNPLCGSFGTLFPLLLLDYVRTISFPVLFNSEQC